MGNKTTNNRRVAKNTLYLYFRMILIMVVSLYTSRVVLAELGVVDYGVYNVVGGVVVMFAFINSSMSTSTQRFLTFELGRGNLERLRATFAASLNVHIFLGLAILLMAETIGLWFVNTKLVIPSERLFAANIVYQSTILSFFLTITQVPYSATLVAHEKMSIYAYMSIFEAFGRLAIAFTLGWWAGDKLVFYSILILFFQILVRLCRMPFRPVLGQRPVQKSNILRRMESLRQCCLALQRTRPQYHPEPLLRPYLERS